MINKDELQYVTMSADRVPYPGDDYAYETINQISRALITFRRKYEGKRFCVSLSTGDTIEFEIKGWNLAHLIGIDYKTLISGYMKKILHDVLELSDEYRINSLVVLNRIIENADKVIANDEVNSVKILNYYKIMFKATNFMKLPDYQMLNFGVLSFNKRIYNNITDTLFSPKSNIYLFSKTGENLVPYNMLGLIYDENIQAMVPETLITPTNFLDYLYEQRLILPLSLKVYDDTGIIKRIDTTREDKIRILNYYKSLMNDCNECLYINGFKEIMPKVKTK